MNERKIEIIVTSNQEQYLNECVRYVNTLRVPEGYEVSLTNVTDAVSMTAAYNEAMHASDAKYKVYIHQDTFLIYEDILNDLLKVFGANPEIGMAGVLGGKNMGQDGNAWNEWNCGRTRAWNTTEQMEIDFQTEAGELTIVDAVDGMFMATQYDIEWREDVATGWDFYDMSQSCEFTRRGYRIAVPYQWEAWCLHDCGHSKFQNYDMARKCFCEVYEEFGYVYHRQQGMDSLREKYDLLQPMVELAGRLLLQKEFALAGQILEKAESFNLRTTELSIMRQIFEITKQESEEKKNCFILDCVNYKSLLEKYTDIKFCLRRIEYGLENGVSLVRSVQKGRISPEALEYMIKCCVYKRDQMKVRNKLKITGE